MPSPDTAPHTNRNDIQAASGRPIGVGYPTYAEAAARLLDNGYEPLQIIPGTKRPQAPRWSAVDIDSAQVERWGQQFPEHGVGLRTGALVGLDIDILDADLAYQIHRLAIDRLGDTLVRVGQWPKRLLLYRTDEPAPKMKMGKVEALGLGQQFVAFGVHQNTGRPYYWPEGETPLDIPFDDLPLIGRDALSAFITEAGALQPDLQPAARTNTQRRTTGPSDAPTRNDAGMVIDGRDGWLSSIAFHAVHDAIDPGASLDPAPISERVWNRFVETTDLARLRGEGDRGYSIADAVRKVADKLRLYRGGRLPKRGGPDIARPDIGPFLPVDEARDVLAATLQTACDAIFSWYENAKEAPPPQIGVRATVGLGKSVAARQALTALRKRLGAIGAPDRIVIFLPSHALAEEASEAWRETGARVAVHRGYDRSDPATGAPMCRDRDAVHLAIAAGLPVRTAACADWTGNRCRHFEGCLKQANDDAVASAEIVIAAYDALFTGLAASWPTFGAILIDEACWPRALREPDQTTFKELSDAPMSGLRTQGGAEAQAAALADLGAYRKALAAALAANGSGPLRRATLEGAGLSTEDCRSAALLEEKRIRDPGLRPGSSPGERSEIAHGVSLNAETRRLMRLWWALSRFVEGSKAQSGRIRVEGAEAEMMVMVENLHQQHYKFRETPVLHLDATLRLDLARLVLPRLEATEIAAEAPFQNMRLITGGFGKSALIDAPSLAIEVRARRAKKLALCVDHVQWEAKRITPRRALVITYKDCEAAFRNIPNVETAHFNAIAGLDRWKDIGLLIVIGRPLPRDDEAARLAAAFFDRPVSGGYGRVTTGVAMRSGGARALRVIRHGNEAAETIRAAIAEDELIQAIGRGRGVNRSDADPLELQVLADVALPILHDSVEAWDIVRPNVFQRMLLASVAVTSPGDAALLHPHLFDNCEQAKKQFSRSGFKGQIPYKNNYRGMSLKSARYRLPGRGRSWANAFWLEGDPENARQTLTAALGALAGWEQDQT